MWHYCELVRRLTLHPGVDASIRKKALDVTHARFTGIIYTPDAALTCMLDPRRQFSVDNVPLLKERHHIQARF